jgi:hypothetical protein
MTQGEYNRRLQALEESIRKGLELTRRHCFEIKYGKIHEN